MSARWIKTTCGSCGGYGVVSDYCADDFLGAKECSGCGGTGRLFVSDKDRLALWPGGPLMGCDPGEYARLAPGEGDK